MMILAILVALVLGLGMFAGMVKVLDEGLEDDDVPVFVMLFIMLAINFVIIVGSFRMMQLKNYGLAMTATIISLLCGLGSCIQLGLAIWALVILSDSNVRDKFT